jgi:FkbM family methyltransferase
MTFQLKISTQHEVFRALTFFDKEPETLRWIDQFALIGKKFVFYDIGANVGIYSLYASAKHPDADVYAFEPESQSFASLCCNIHNNQLNILPYAFAMSENSGIDILNVNELRAGAGASALGGEYIFSKPSVNGVFKQGTCFMSIDDLVYRYQFPVPNFLKIDVDGIEFLILKGASRVLRAAECRSVLVEVQWSSDAEKESIFTYLNFHGFVMSEQSLWSIEAGGIRSQNFIFNKTDEK